MTNPRRTVSIKRRSLAWLGRRKNWTVWYCEGEPMSIEWRRRPHRIEWNLHKRKVATYRIRIEVSL